MIPTSAGPGAADGASQRPDHIRVRGARVHNLRAVDVEVPLNRLVGIAGVSGSGKSSLALGVLRRLTDRGATVVVIEHDLDLIANADHVIDLGPGGGTAGGRIVATGTPAEVSRHPDSVTGPYLARHVRPSTT